MAKFNIDATEAKTMGSLKDFQRATVERIDYLFRNGQNRVLIADEVGMGKTLIARGAIVKTARLRIEEGDDLLKVVYICSNTSIANQNIQKLKVSNTAKIEGVSDTRLSMLHLKITEQEADESLREGFIQLIPLTPDTSFRLTNGGGTVSERALMFAVLSRLPELAPHLHELEKMFVYFAEGAWNSWAKDWYKQKVADCETQTNGDYPANIINRLYAYDKERPFLDMLVEHCTKRRNNSSPYKDVVILNTLRVMFARISTEMLNPDLVIMDEFQRFKFLLNSNQDSETGILAQKFLSGDSTRILLLSATPYKLYSTLDEIDEAQLDEHYSEFLQVMDFLFEDKKSEFHRVWSDYSVALHEMSDGNTTMLQVKNAAEDAMYAGVCRTERVSVMDSGDYTDDSSVKTPLTISDKDILSYIEAGNLLKAIGVNFTLPLDYVKSCPYLMSFMRNYKVKQNIEKHFASKPDEVDKARSDLLWISPSHINDYRKLPATNARLEKLKEVAFTGNAELYLWVPPSKPYYALQGAYRDSADFSKVLVFSAWEMVPRMIGALISYEAERRTVGKLSGMAKNVDRKNTRYNAKYRYPYHRLQFSLSGGEPQKMSLFCLLYPSKTLAALYTPIQSLNQGHTLADIERQIKAELRTKLSGLRRYQQTESGPEDAKWYYLAPMLMDGHEWVNNWITSLEEAMRQDDGEVEEAISSDRGNKAFHLHLDRLRQYVSDEAQLELGRMPEDLLNTLTDMVLGSPAICVYRTNGGNVAYATSLAKVFVNYFNSTESTAIVELAAEQFHTKKADDNTHWQDVLLYCKDGCFQAMFDEYYHLIRESVSFSEDDKRDGRIQNIMLNDLRIHTASYEVDTFNTFRNRVQGERKRNLMRAHYAVGFVTDGDDAKKSSRKDSIRGAFNSPLKPFVLASTSIGQEGLDFHNYCRKIMHWNLPNNPIDLEQREGRINRFKCLAIRQNVAAHYGDISFTADVWSEMFHAAQAEKKEHQSDLVPFWCFGENQKIKIERIVPMYPMSKDEITYERLIKILSLYRLTLGQARQEELLEYIFKECSDTEELKKLFIDLSPFSKKS
ncbi:MAG: hypothetical protein IJ403_06320 [Oscillospiraceae bacterium]|nr:hypothetical protein [Oscillospiraceae bacterium]